MRVFSDYLVLGYSQELYFRYSEHWIIDLTSAQVYNHSLN